ncbi:MAG: PQQ-dependent sugar dehydrogenase [Solirubrobacterales bacterium]
MTRTALAALLSLLTAPCLAGCGSEDDERSTAQAPPAATTAGEQRRSHRPPPVGDGKGGVELEEIGSFDSPVYVTQPPEGDDSLYVVEQTGKVQRVPERGGPEVFLDLSGEVSCCGEQGLLSIAFAPDYAKSGLLYASFTNADGDSRIVEYRSESGEPVDASEGREVLAVDQPYPNHNGGLVMFGPDGSLYAGYGDGGGGGDPERNAQDPGTLLGKLVQVDVGRSADHQIVAIGLRNPWRFSFDRETDDLWIGDVGQDEFEEIDGVSGEDARGANFGWSAYEADVRFNEDQDAPGHTPPVFTYSHGEGCSVTGGYVVRDPELESLYGRYLYGDYCQGELRSFTAEPGRKAGDDTMLGVPVPGLSSFGEDVAGHVYAVSVEGPVYRLAPAGER